MDFGTRLAAERRRLGLKQAELAALVDSDAQKQSLYENNKRELRGDYLARLSQVGIDISFVLTGSRFDSRQVGDGAARVLDLYVAMPPRMQSALETVAAAMIDGVGQEATVHDQPIVFRPEPPDQD